MRLKKETTTISDESSSGNGFRARVEALLVET